MGLAAAAAGAGAIASIGGGMIAAGGAKKAANAQAAAAESANAAQERMFQKQLDLQEPFRQGGLTAQNRIMELMGLPAINAGPTSGVYGSTNPQDYGLTPYTPRSPIGTSRTVLPGRAQGAQVYRDAQGNIVSDAAAYMAQHPLAQPAESARSADFGKYARDFGMADFEADPGYAFRQSEGMKALERSAAARGGLMSGSAMKGIQRFGQDLASQEYSNAFNRYQVNRSNQLNPLQSLMGSGQSATNMMTGAAGQAGQNQASNIYNAGAARASGYVGGANALGGALAGAGQMVSQFPMANAMMNYYNSGAPGGVPKS